MLSLGKSVRNARHVPLKKTNETRTASKTKARSAQCTCLWGHVASGSRVTLEIPPWLPVTEKGLQAIEAKVSLAIWDIGMGGPHTRVEL